MKRLIILFVLALMMSNIRAQEALVFETVINKEGQTTEDLYNLIKRWIAHNYNSAKDVIQLDNPNKELTLKAKINYEEKNMTWAAASGYIDYTVDFLIKDNKFKVIIGPFSHTSTHIKWGKEWSNGLLYKDELTDELFEKIGVKKIARKQYREVDKRVQPLAKKEIEQITLSLANEVDNLEKSKKDDWDF